MNLNGLPSPMQSKYGTLPSLAAVDRVEIMRALRPLQQHQRAGGVINMVLKRPTDAFKGSVTARYGSWDRHYLEADMGAHSTTRVPARPRRGGQRRHQEPGGLQQQRQRYLLRHPGVRFSRIAPASVHALHQTKDILPTNGLPAYKDGSCSTSAAAPTWGRLKTFDADTTDGGLLQHALPTAGGSGLGPLHGSRHAAGSRPSPTALWTRRATPG